VRSTLKVDCHVVVTRTVLYVDSVERGIAHSESTKCGIVRCNLVNFGHADLLSVVPRLPAVQGHKHGSYYSNIVIKSQY
jgi:hypothetical protein